MKSVWETHKGKKIFYARYDHLSLEEVRSEVAAVEKEMLKQPPDSVLLLVDITGTIISPEALNLYKNVALHSNKILHKTALLGVPGARKTLVDIIAKFSGLSASSFDDGQKARDWLVS